MLLSFPHKSIWRRLLLAALASLPLGAARAAVGDNDWPSYHRTPTNDTHLALASTVQALSTPTWQTSTTEQLFSTSGIVIGGGKVLAVAQTGGDTFFDLSDDTFRVRAYNLLTGARLWTSPLLAPGSSVGNQSVTTPAIEHTEPLAPDSAYIAAGHFVHKLALSSGSVLWSSALTTATTTPGLSGYDVINSSPALGAGKVFIEVNGGNFVSNDKQIVALNGINGTIAWFHNDKGSGLGTPLFVDLGTTKTVYTAIAGGIAAYDANTGVQRWTNKAVLAGTTWTLSNDIFGSIAYSNGKLYATTFPFSVSDAPMICVDARTGQLLHTVSAPCSDVVPLVLNGRVYIQGGAFGAARLAAFDATTLAPIFDVATGGFSFRTIMAAANNRIYMTDQSRLMIVDPTTGAVGSTVTAAYDGAVALDTAGAVYAHNGQRLAAFRNFVTGVGQSWQLYQ